MVDQAANSDQYPFGPTDLQTSPSAFLKPTRRPRGSSLSLVEFYKFNPRLSDISVFGPEHLGYSEINNEIGF